MKTILGLLLIASVAKAQDFGGTPPLTGQMLQGVGITQKWASKSLETMGPEPGKDGAIEFRFGESYPTIVCSPLELTDIELEPGEQITEKGYLVGDTAQWLVVVARSGPDAQGSEHVIVKPQFDQLATDLVITTDRRTYHLLLASTERYFMHHIRFLYSGSPIAMPVVKPLEPAQAPNPSDKVSTSVAYHEPSQRQPEGKAAVSKNTHSSDDYFITGKAPWAPVSAYHDGQHTYLEMPAGIHSTESPILYLTRKSGWFHHDKVQCNYRVKNGWYKIDGIVDEAELVAGKAKVRISRQ